MPLKGFNEIVQNLINNIHDALPEIDTKEGTFIRDVFIDPGASELAEIYDEIRSIEIARSPLTASGEDLDKLAENFFIERKSATKSYGTVRFYLKTPITEPFTIPAGTKVFVPATSTSDRKSFITTESRFINTDFEQYDTNFPDLIYVDIPVESEFEGSEANVEPGAITEFENPENLDIVSVTNPLPLTGGTDAEDDLSLALRISMALSGANIGTKDGYTSFILKQEEVIDARVVGAGDPLMKRDQGKGGMVDIYVRANGTEEETYDFTVTKDYITEQIDRPAYPNIILPQQPVVNIISITGHVEGSLEPKTYLDGSDFLIERGSNKYYLDVLWTFKYAEGDSLEAQAVNILNEKLSRVDFLENIDYYLNWNLINPDNDNVNPEDPDFLRGYYPDDNKIYQIKTKVDPNNPYVGNRYFIKKNNEIYERKYYNPDFILVKDTSDYGYSYLSKDAIKWLETGNKPVENEVLTIKYSYMSVVNDLQKRIEQKKVLTADVLIKHAKRMGIEVYAEIVPYNSYNVETVKNAVIDRVTTYINSVKKLGGVVSVSDIAYVIRGTDGVDDVGLDTLKLSVTNGPPQKQIAASEFEYMEVDKVTIYVHPVGTIV